MPYYNTPKIDWAVPDIVQTSDMNNIGENLQTCRIGGGESSLPSAAIAADLTLDLVHNVFQITGFPTVINRIEYTDGSTTREYGNIITLIFDTACTINTTGTANSSTHLGIHHSYLTVINIFQYDVLQFVIGQVSSVPVWHALTVHNTGNG